MLDDRRWKAVPAIGNFGDRASLPSALLASYPVTLTTPLHRIRHYGLFANGNRAANIARARELLGVPSRPKPVETSETTAADEPRMLPRPCQSCGGRMILIETFAAGCQPKHRPAPATAAVSIDTS